MGRASTAGAMGAPSRYGRLARFAALLLVAAVTMAGCRLPDLPRLEEQPPPRPLDQTSMIFDRRGGRLATLHAEQDRILVPLGRIPPVVRDAVVAIEDARFWDHRGVDLKALARAAYANYRTGRIVEGGSTITQQYVKNTIVGPEVTLDRKVREAVLALQLEDRMSKEAILEGYLNTVYFGNGAYGVRVAARRYFSRPPEDITLPQAALLAGLIAAPERWDPIDAPDLAIERRNLVLDRMLELGMIDPGGHAHAVGSPLGLDLTIDRSQGPGSHFVEYVKDQILRSRQFGETYQERYDFLFRGGLRIHTTLDPRLQRLAEQSIRGVLSQPSDPYGAMTAIDPRTGHILAMASGRGATGKRDPYRYLNLATGGITGRQAGSSFKPFALVAALESGISPLRRYQGGTVISIADERCPGSTHNPWVVRNYEGSAYGELTLEDATINSVNVVYAQLIRELTPARVIDTAGRMGIRSPLREYCSSVLGSNEVNTLEMASAYGTLAAGGLRVPPVAITRITDSDGNVVWEPEAEPEQAVNPAVAWITTQILRKVILQGTGRNAQLGRPAAGKTGTAQMWRDAWFAGYVPQLSAAVWVGFPKAQIPMVPPRTRIRVTGGSFPALIWHAFMTRATRNLPVLTFPKPTGHFVVVAVDPNRACVPTDYTPRKLVKRVEYVSGTEPIVLCPDGPGYTGDGTVAPGTVPSVLGLPVTTARAFLEAAGLEAEIQTEYEPAYPSGTVLAQDPAPGSARPPGGVVRLVVSTTQPPPVTVPSVIGLPEDDARAQILAAGLRVRAVVGEAFDPAYPPGVVTAQSPAGGEHRESGARVTITLNPDPPPAPSPSPTE